MPLTLKDISAKIDRVQTTINDTRDIVVSNKTTLDNHLKTDDERFMAIHSDIKSLRVADQSAQMQALNDLKGNRTIVITGVIGLALGILATIITKAIL